MSERSKPNRWVRISWFAGAVGVSAAVVHLALSLSASAPPARARPDAPPARFIAAPAPPRIERAEIPSPSPATPPREQAALRVPPPPPEDEARPAEDRQAVFDRASALVEAAKKSQRWGEEQAAEMGQLFSRLDPQQADQVLRSLIPAVNAQEIRVDINGPLF